MKAGRELDALIAEKVMGWTRCNDPAHGKECSFWWDEDGMGQGRFEFSTDIAAAWEVVEKLRLVVSPTDKEIGWMCQYGKFSWVVEETAPLAICLAALKAVGVEVNESA